MKNLTDLFLSELADMYDAERRIVKALPKMAKAATCPKVQAAFRSHLQESEGHVKKLQEVFEFFGVNPRGQTCEATVGLLKEGDELAADFKGSDAINAALICAAQKVEHYEIASYGCLHAWAILLENEAAADLLEEILKEERNADETLNKLALNTNNEEALTTGRREAARMLEAKLPRTQVPRAVRPAAPGRTRLKTAVR